MTEAVAASSRKMLVASGTRISFTSFPVFQSQLCQRCITSALYNVVLTGFVFEASTGWLVAD